MEINLDNIIMEFIDNLGGDYFCEQNGQNGIYNNIFYYKNKKLCEINDNELLSLNDKKEIINYLKNKLNIK